MRKLASIQKIKEIRPIENADRLELAIVNGWKVVIRKDEHQENDLVVYCEIDSFLPVKDEFEFLRKSSYKKMADGTEGFRLRTVKLRGQISQGLVLPLDVIPEDVLFDLVDQTRKEHDYLIGTDVTEALDIVKYEPPIPAQLSGKIKGYFPSFISKTDEERAQNLDNYDKLKNSNEEFYATEKLDGSSSTFYLNDGEFGVCSRNLDLLEDDSNTFWKVAKELNIKEKLAILNKNVAIQGELVGEGIQGNPYGIKGHTIHVFNIFDINTHQKYSYTSFMYTLALLNLKSVPLVYSNLELPNTIDELLSLAEGKSELNPETEREGLVIRNKMNTISFKAISNKFLLQDA